MKKTLLVSIACILCYGCDGPTDSTVAQEPETAPETDPHHGGHDHHQMNTLPAAEPAGGSLYQLTAELADQNDEEVSWEDFRGEKLVVAMIYTSCTTACPLIIAEIKTIRKLAKSDVRVLLISMDPDNDTAEARAGLQKRHQLDERWTVAGTTDSRVRELAAALGVRYRKLPDGSFNHSQVITVLDEGGTPLAREEGLGVQREDVVSVLAL